MSRAHAFLALLAASVAALCTGFTSPAQAAPPSYVFDGGTANEQSQVTQALAASSFDWSLIGQQITVHIGDYEGDYAVPGQVYLDASLLDSGTFAWGTVLHEFGHQVDFALLNDTERAQLNTALGGTVWTYAESPTPLQHDQYGCERFASELAWAYWPSAENSMSPRSIGVEADGMPPSQFRALLAQILGQPSLAGAASATTTTTAAGAPVTTPPAPVAKHVSLKATRRRG